MEPFVNYFDVERLEPSFSGSSFGRSGFSQSNLCQSGFGQTDYSDNFRCDFQDICRPFEQLKDTVDILGCSN